ncbi:MAG: hypothetical protein EOR57_18935 [Mesorhizobium sp.]|nr:MAG: hypothetical protein EOR57_18935 [Mesorhizobium sp.]
MSAGQRPPLSCRTSPPLVGEMSGRTEGGAKDRCRSQLVGRGRPDANAPLPNCRPREPYPHLRKCRHRPLRVLQSRRGALFPKWHTDPFGAPR